MDILRSRRQLGSVIKPFVYSAAMQNGGYEQNTIFADVPVRFGGERQILQNADGLYMGWMGLPKALAQSRNVPAAQALYLAGGERATIKYLDANFGFDIAETYPEHAFGWTVALGTPPLKPHSVAAGYAALATNQYKELCPIVKIETLHGMPVDLPCETEPKAKIPEEIGYFVADSLNDTKWRPQRYWREADVPNYPEIAIKTGTSNKRVGKTLLPADNWIAGYTPKMTAVMWAGNTNGRALNEGAFALSSLGIHFGELWNRVFEDYPEHYGAFAKPESVKKFGQYWIKNNTENKAVEIPSMQILGGASEVFKVKKEETSAPVAESEERG